MTVVLPYDGSAVARAALRRLAQPAYRRWVRGRVLLLLPPGPRCSVPRRRSEARRVAGAALVLRFGIAPDDPATLAEEMHGESSRTFVAPVPAHGATRWYRAVTAALLTGRQGRRVALYLDGHDTADAERRSRTVSAAHRVERAGVHRPFRWAHCHKHQVVLGAQEVEP